MKAILPALILLYISFGCKKENQNTNAQQTTANLSLNRYHFTDFADTGRRERKHEHAIAEFIAGNYYQDAGSVKYGDSTLYRGFTYRYLSYKPDDPVPDFIHALDGGRTWSVTGNAQNQIPAFSTSAPQFPSFFSKRFDTLPVVFKSQPFTISWDNTLPCDSISIVLLQSNTNVQSGILPGNISSFTFSPAQLSVFQTAFSTLANVLIIEGRTYKNITVSDVKVKVENYAKRTSNVKFVN